jgi:hypothetical protein
MAMPNRSVVSKVVNAHEVEGLTMNGWRLDDVLQESSVECFNESTPLVVPGQSYPTTYNGTKGFVVTKNLFVMKKDGSAIVAEAEEALAQTEKARKNFADRTIEAEKKTVEAQKEVATLKSELATSAAFARQLSTQLVTERDLKQKMENDIAKIRQAVGELKMKEILGQ